MLTTELKLELIRRYSSWYDRGAGLESVEWVMSSTADYTHVTTRTAFALAKAGYDVMCVDEDADYQLEVDEQDEHYPDKNKTYPEIETIFLVEGTL